MCYYVLTSKINYSKYTMHIHRSQRALLSSYDELFNG